MPATDREDLPAAVRRVVEALAGSAGAQAVVLAGSRASEAGDANSDWDLTVYYRGNLDLAPLATFGEVHPPGTWGRLMNGGAWLVVDGVAVDVMLRDLDVVEQWSAAAERGVYELDAVLGYLAGLPTYMLLAELASGRLLAGALPAVAGMPRALVEAAPPRWRFARDFSLEYARMHAARGNAIGAIGQATKAVLEEAHARLCARGAWVLNEKRMVRDAGLDAVQARFSAPPGQEPRELVAWLDAIAASLAAADREVDRHDEVTTPDTLAATVAAYLGGELSFEAAATALSAVDATHFLRVRPISPVPAEMSERTARVEALLARAAELRECDRSEGS